MQQFIPVFKDEVGVKDNADVVLKRRIGVRFLESMEFPTFEITQPRCEALADQGEESKDMITGAAGGSPHACWSPAYSISRG